MTSFLFGTVAMASLVAALFFLRFWRKTGDRFFLFFALAFLVDAIGRTILGVQTLPEEHVPLIYGGRLVTFGLILAAIIDKNRKPPTRR
jgi:quinol-cytochrome oxidoreductase complex cytochrome b subunit